MPIIKRYSNRKYYNTATSKYVTLDDIGQIMRLEQDVQIVDHATGDDLTALVLSQVVFENAKKVGGMLPQFLISRLIRYTQPRIADSLMQLITRLDPDELINNEIKRRLQVLADQGNITAVEKDHLGEMLVSTKLRKKRDEGGEPSVDAEDVEILRRQLEDLEKQVASLEKDSPNRSH